MINNPLSVDDLIEIGLRAFRENARGKRRSMYVHDGAMLEQIRQQRQQGNPTHIIRCNKCHIEHPIYSDNHNHLLGAAGEFQQKHLKCGEFATENGIVYDDEACGLPMPRLESQQVWKSAIELFSVPIWYQGLWTPNSDMKAAFQAEQSLTVTNLHSLANSATAGWCGGSVDNSSNLYLDSFLAAHIAAVNTAPASNKAAYHYAYGSTDGAIWTSTGTSGGTVGTEGTLTFPSISTPLPVLMPLIGITSYPVQNKALDGGPYTIAKGFGGILPTSWGIAELNFTGMTYAASGNTRKYRGCYNTII